MWKPQIFELTKEGILSWEPKHFLFPSKNPHACKSFKQATRLLKQRSGRHDILKGFQNQLQCPL